ncbi:MAG: hypothetical protein WBA41_32030 [Rivularia sp. (in: cyanobacteria)]
MQRDQTARSRNGYLSKSEAQATSGIIPLREEGFDRLLVKSTSAVLF